jgi:hypothetical protein
MGKLLTDASYKPRDKKKEVADAKAGKGKPGFMDLTKPKAGK